MKFLKGKAGEVKGYYLVPLRIVPEGVFFASVNPATKERLPFKLVKQADLASQVEVDEGLTYAECDITLTQDEHAAYAAWQRACALAQVPRRGRKRKESPSPPNDSGDENDDDSDGDGGSRPQQPANESFGQKRLKVSATRHTQNTAAKGLQLGVATWNVHGLQKPANDTVRYALSFGPYLEEMYKKIEDGKARRSKSKSKSKDGKKIAVPQDDAIRLKSLVDTYLELTTPADGTPEQRAARLEELHKEERPPTAQNRGKGRAKNSYNAVCQSAVLTLTCEAIVRLFSTNDWLDVLMLQEVKRTGMDILEAFLARPEIIAIADLKIVWGPLIKCTSAKTAEWEYYPLILRKDGKSRHHPAYTITVRKIWWIDETGADTGEMGVDEQNRDPARPNYSWSKWARHRTAQDIKEFRPFVVYDLQIGPLPTGLVHVAVIHTTPGTQIDPLTDEEVKSSKAFEDLMRGLRGARPSTAASRQRAIADSEFHRIAEYRQVSAAFEKVNTNCYGENAKYQGPWVMGGDYYLFEESVVMDVGTAMLGGTEKQQEDLQRLVEAEYGARTKDYGVTAGLLNQFQQRETTFRQMIQPKPVTAAISSRRKPKPEFYLPPLRADDCAILANTAVGSDAVTRGVLQRHRSLWLDTARAYDELDSDTLLDLCTRRADMYAELVMVCAFYRDRSAALLRADANDWKSKMAALALDSEALMKRAQSGKGESGKTVMGLPLRPREDPLRNVLGSTVGAQTPSGLQLSQAVSGSNILGKYMLNFSSDDAAKWQPLQPKLKVADFLVHTRYDAATGRGMRHWRASVIGLLTLKGGKIALADDATLATSRFWAKISDHFPVGGVLSTADSPNAPARLQRKYTTQAVNAQELDDFERQRRRRHIRDLLLRAGIQRNCDGQAGVLDPLIASEPVDTADLAALDTYIVALEEACRVESSSRMERKGKVMHAADFQSDVNFIVGSAHPPSPDQPDPDDGQWEQAQAMVRRTYAVHATPGDGNCLFHALWSSMEDAGFPDLPSGHAELRKTVVNSYAVNLDLARYEGVTQEYVETMREPAEDANDQQRWGSDAEIRAFCALYNANVVVISADYLPEYDYQAEITPPGDADGRYLLTLYHTGGNHWSWLTPLSAAAPGMDVEEEEEKENQEDEKMNLEPDEGKENQEDEKMNEEPDEGKENQEGEKMNLD